MVTMRAVKRSFVLFQHFPKAGELSKIFSDAIDDLNVEITPMRASIDSFDAASQDQAE